MADKIQLTLEGMLPELESLVKEGLFNKNEIKKIIKKRRFHEYELERKDVTKYDYYRAIKYEKLLIKKTKYNKKQKKIKKFINEEFHCKKF